MPCYNNIKKTWDSFENITYLPTDKSSTRELLMKSSNIKIKILMI